jgi:hypothetical protein
MPKLTASSGIKGKGYERGSANSIEAMCNPQIILVLHCILRLYVGEAEQDHNAKKYFCEFKKYINSLHFAFKRRMNFSTNSMVQHERHERISEALKSIRHASPTLPEIAS